jgi:hypothetical protein
MSFGLFERKTRDHETGVRGGLWLCIVCVSVVGGYGRLPVPVGPTGTGGWHVNKDRDSSVFAFRMKMRCDDANRGQTNSEGALLSRSVLYCTPICFPYG